jgi:hypothetical protein
MDDPNTVVLVVLHWVLVISFLGAVLSFILIHVQEWLARRRRE